MPTKIKTHKSRSQAGKVAMPRRDSPSVRGYGVTWQRTRRAFLARYPLCARCSEIGRVHPATEADHVIPKARGGSDGWSNLQPLCKMHHSQKTMREQNARR